MPKLGSDPFADFHRIDIDPSVPNLPGIDLSVPARSRLQQQLNARGADRATLEKEHGQVWDSMQMQGEFQPEAFLAPYMIATRRQDGKKGVLVFQHAPRFYWGWTPEAE